MCHFSASFYCISVPDLPCVVSKKIFIFCRTWSSFAAGLWDNFWGSWGNMCLPIAGYQNKVNFWLCQIVSISTSIHFGISLLGLILVLVFRMQAQPTNKADAYKGMSDVFRKTFQHEGFRGFYKGLFPNLLKVVPSASITYLVYETMKKSLELD